MNFKVEELQNNKLRISFSERLDIDNVAEIWRPCVLAVSEYHVHSLILDFAKVDYCDGSGVALIQELQKKQEKIGGICLVENLKEDFQRLLEYVEVHPNKVKKEFLLHESFPIHLGHIAVDIIRDISDNITFLGMLACQLFVTLFKGKKIRWRDFARVVEETGPQALPIVTLIGFLIGLISTFQAAPSFKEFGVQIYMVNLVALGLVREMGPLLTAVLLTGRTASAFAAEIGTMKINQEIDALKTMGLDPVRFLVVPRIIATMIITPILEMFFIIFGLFGCLVVMYVLGYTSDAFMQQLHQAVAPIDYVGGLIKVFVFGIVIAGVGCLHGIKTRFGAKAVGNSTTQAVVSSLIMLVLVDGIFALIYYVLDI